MHYWEQVLTMTTILRDLPSRDPNQRVGLLTPSPGLSARASPIGVERAKEAGAGVSAAMPSNPGT